MKTIHIGTSPLTNRIFAGHVLQCGTAFAANKQDVTGAACGAVCEHVMANGGDVVVTANGKPRFEITVRDLEEGGAQPAPSVPEQPAPPFQARVKPWLLACFGETIASDRDERNHRFLEEALELVQSLGCSAHEAHQLVGYVFGRPVGEPRQEVGGVMVTLAALCLASGLDMHADGETELARINVPETVLKIRAKQAAKPKHSPLPEVPAIERITPEQAPEGVRDYCQEAAEGYADGWNACIKAMTEAKP